MVIDPCSPADDNGATPEDGNGRIRIRLSFEVDSIEDEDKYVSVLAFHGVRTIVSELVSEDAPPL